MTLTYNLAASPNLVKRDLGLDLPCPFLQQEESLVRKAMLLTAQKSYSADCQILYESHSDVRSAQRLFGGASEEVRNRIEVVLRRVNEADANYAVDVEVDASRGWRIGCVEKVHAVFKRSVLGFVFRRSTSLIHEAGTHSLVKFSTDSFHS